MEFWSNGKPLINLKSIRGMEIWESGKPALSFTTGALRTPEFTGSGFIAHDITGDGHIGVTQTFIELTSDAILLGSYTDIQADGVIDAQGRVFPRGINPVGRVFPLIP